MFNTHREANEENILDNVAPNLIPDSHGRGPCPPIRTLRICVRLPTAERSIKIKRASILNITADSRLHVSQPITGHINACCNTSYRKSSGNQNPPDLARISSNLDLPEKTSAVGRELP
jgi:hypothetical protein